LSAAGEGDDFSRRVYCILGVPVDAINMAGLVERVHRATATRKRLFLSTPNLNFLMLSQRDAAFRHSLIASDLCPADGVGVLLICRMLGVPIASRVAGSDLPSALQASPPPAGNGPLRIAFLGGEPGVGERARKVVNAGNTDRLICVAAINPGVMTGDKMSDPALVRTLNASVADFLLVALGAQKGQAWLMANRHALNVPVISHLGATLNFLAGRVRRAPTPFRRLGLEWLWRMGQEPHLIKRYASDGLQLIWLLASRVAPLGLWLRWNRRRHSHYVGRAQGFHGEDGRNRISVGGAAHDEDLLTVQEIFRDAITADHGIILDLQDMKFFGMGFAGHVLMLEKAAQTKGRALTIVGASRSVTRALNWCGLSHLMGAKGE
jgi:N-acetylglucosaminyldiphosphoundecaprenol N-acetyl-beta-D-mannosaminyltransferase